MSSRIESPSSSHPLRASAGELRLKQISGPCRSCASENLHLILDLGRLPLANALLTKEQTQIPEEKYPLTLAFCPRCSLVQITETIPAERLFRHYLYFSSFAETAVSRARETAERLVGSRQLNSQSKVIEIASNDGYLLQFYKKAGVSVLGIEPAMNIAATARERGIPTVSEFFSPDLARQLASEGNRADVIHANNVLAHVGDLAAFLTGLGVLLKKDAVAVIEIPYVREMIERVEFDTIYHEHLSYFSLTALQSLFTLRELRIVDVERIAIHGGSLRIFAERNAGSSKAPEAVAQLLAEEARLGLEGLGFYQDFAQKVQHVRAALVECLKNLKSQGKRIAAYGASAKGATLLNYCGIDSAMLDFVADRSPAKQGLYTPGTHLPICAPERILKDKPDCVLLLTWNFAEEILKQQAEYRRLGGQFLVPIPEPHFIPAGADLPGCGAGHRPGERGPDAICADQDRRSFSY